MCELWSQNYSLEWNNPRNVPITYVDQKYKMNNVKGSKESWIKVLASLPVNSLDVWCKTSKVYLFYLMMAQMMVHGVTGSTNMLHNILPLWALRAPPCTALHCTALHCTALHCTALHCTPSPSIRLLRRACGHSQKQRHNMALSYSQW
jgi:hypothetical protein